MFDARIRYFRQSTAIVPAMPEACKLQSKQLRPDYVSSYTDLKKYFLI